MVFIGLKHTVSRVLRKKKGEKDEALKMKQNKNQENTKEIYSRRGGRGKIY